MRNNKGFTLVELLSTIVIVSIIAITGVVAYTSYIQNTRNKAYDMMAQSAANAASEYAIDYPGIESVTFKELTEEEYLEYPADPANSSRMCLGRVDITNITTEVNILEVAEYDVVVCCSNFNYKYHFPGGKKTKLKEEEIIVEKPTPTQNPEVQEEPTPGAGGGEEPTPGAGEGEESTPEENESEDDENQGEDEDE